MSKRLSKRLSRRLSRRNKKNMSKRNKRNMKGGTGFRAPEYVNFVPFSKTTFNNSEPLVRALGAASR